MSQSAELGAKDLRSAAVPFKRDKTRFHKYHGFRGINEGQLLSPHALVSHNVMYGGAYVPIWNSGTKFDFSGSDVNSDRFPDLRFPTPATAHTDITIVPRLPGRHAIRIARSQCRVSYCCSWCDEGRAKAAAGAKARNQRAWRYEWPDEAERATEQPLKQGWGWTPFDCECDHCAPDDEDLPDMTAWNAGALVDEAERVWLEKRGPEEAVAGFEGDYMSDWDGMYWATTATTAVDEESELEEQDVWERVDLESVWSEWTEDGM